MEEHRFKVFEYKELRRISEPQRENGREIWRKYHNKNS
jgi:hypothetical protein